MTPCGLMTTRATKGAFTRVPTSVRVIQGERSYLLKDTPTCAGPLTAPVAFQPLPPIPPPHAARVYLSSYSATERACPPVKDWLVWLFQQYPHARGSPRARRVCDIPQARSKAVSGAFVSGVSSDDIGDPPLKHDESVSLLQHINQPPGQLPELPLDPFIFRHLARVLGQGSDTAHPAHVAY